MSGKYLILKYWSVAVIVTTGLVGCGDNDRYTWREALTVWGNAWCERYEVCSPNGYDVYFHNSFDACVTYAVERNCGTGFDCADRYPHDLGTLSECEEDMRQVSCFVYYIPRSCLDAFRREESPVDAGVDGGCCGEATP